MYVNKIKFKAYPSLFCLLLRYKTFKWRNCLLILNMDKIPVGRLKDWLRLLNDCVLQKYFAQKKAVSP